MITRSELGTCELDSLNRSLGTPSAQRIFELLTCWDSLSTKDIIKKSGISESQIYTTLGNLEKAGLVTKKTRGIYTTTDTKFTKLLKDAYLAKIEQVIGRELYFLGKHIDTLPLEQISERWTPLVEQWEPILREKFPQKMSSLAGHIVDREIQRLEAAK